MSTLSFQSALPLASGTSSLSRPCPVYGNSQRMVLVGNRIPQLGFGVAYGFGKHENPAEVTKPSLAEALKVGYRLVSSASSIEEF